MKFQERLVSKLLEFPRSTTTPCPCTSLYRNSPVLILDEATSALDSGNEEIIQDAMMQLIKGKQLLIAHRFSSIRLANRI